ncbi:MAG: membrane protein insertion efficiency factor YidD [Alphaproteobacteria bacterium]|nr:membrane protein insertion efficiency factor YidD [Alphaproteobacteria bacterium]
MKHLLLFLIKIYTTCFSALTGAKCRFSPTCSAYARESINKFGVFKGGTLAIRRLSRCHPYYKGPFIDPPPP